MWETSHLQGENKADTQKKAETRDGKIGLVVFASCLSPRLLHDRVFSPSLNLMSQQIPHFGFCLFPYLPVLGVRCCLGFSLVVMSGGLLSSGSAQRSYCGSISCRRAQAVGRAGPSSCSSRAQPLQLLGSTAQAPYLQCLGLVPGPGIKLVSPASAGRFFSTEPPGKPLPDAPTLPRAHFV